MAVHPNPQDCEHMMNMGRRGFLGMLAAGALSLLAGGVPVQADDVERHVVIDYAWAACLRTETTGLAEVRWCLPGGEWQITKGTISEEKRVLWLTNDIGIDFVGMWK